CASNPLGNACALSPTCVPLLPDPAPVPCSRSHFPHPTSRAIPGYCRLPQLPRPPAPSPSRRFPMSAPALDPFLTLASLKQVPQPAQDRPLVLPTRKRADDPPRQLRERQRLQPHAPRPGERRQEQPLAAEETALDAAHPRDVVIDAWLK